jgi:DNA-binding response OmpR family regulator
MNPARVIIVEDNEELCEELLFQLEVEGFFVRCAHDAVELDILLSREPCDILVLDLNLPGEDGFSIARRLCNQHQRGIIMLTARDNIDDKLRGFEDGADIYLVKPIDRRELAACIKALYRRLLAIDPSGSGWIFNSVDRTLFSPDGRQLGLTAQEQLVLTLLIENPNNSCSRLELVRGLGIEFMPSPEGRTNTVMSRLRQKLTAFDPELRIVSWRNKGYSYVGPCLGPY